MKSGQRVRDEFLGEGTVIEKVTHLPAVMVRFDNTPPYDYNLGSNPCMRFFDTIKPIDDCEGRHLRGGGEG